MKVLYVGRDKAHPDEFCPGSIVCMSILETIAADVQVQDCSVLRKSVQLPAWLNGTPMFIDEDASAPLRGRDAIRALQAMRRAEETASAQAQQPMQRLPSMPPPSRGTLPPPRMSRDAQTSAKKASNDAGGFFDPGEDDDGGLQSAFDPPMDATENGSNANVKDAPIGESKVTEDDLQRFMEQRNSTIPHGAMQNGSAM